MDAVTHHCRLGWHHPIVDGHVSHAREHREAMWTCSCGVTGTQPTLSLAAQRFAEHYALAKQQAAPKVRRGAPEHDGGRTLTADTVRDSERAVLMAIRFRSMIAADSTDEVIREVANTAHVATITGRFSPSRLRTARVELQRAGLVEVAGVTQVGGKGRRMRVYRLTASGWTLAREFEDVTA